MRSRDIDGGEILAVLARPRSAHEPGKAPGRREVAGYTDRGSVRIVYEFISSDVVMVITTYVD